MSKITIVTAFFDIGRKDFKSIPRDNQEYLEYFKFWARLKNDLVVYTDSNMAKEVRKIRKEFGLIDNTTVIEINDISIIEPEILERMKKIEKSKEFLGYRWKKDLPENSAIYNYIMLLKSWCIKDCVEKKLAEDMIAWVDFGFNHGGKYYTHPEDFDTIWEFDLDKKIYFCALKPDDEIPIFKLVQSLDVYITGCSFLIHTSLAEEFWKLARESMLSLIRVGFMDDDQLLYLMMIRERPELFEVSITGWFTMLKEFGLNNIRTKEKKEIKNKNLIQKFLYKCRVLKWNFIYFKRLIPILFRKELY